MIKSKLSLKEAGFSIEQILLYTIIKELDFELQEHIEEYNRRNYMKTSVKKASSFFMAVAVMLSCITITPVSVSAWSYEIGALIDSGNCGAVGSETSVKWELTKNGEVDGNDTYTITIKGNGAMYDYTPNEEDPEWVTNYASNITKIVIGYGITRIGNDSFYDCEKVEEVVFERNVKKGVEKTRENLSLYICVSLLTWNRWWRLYVTSEPSNSTICCYYRWRK